jgi:hypothetical protein
MNHSREEKIEMKRLGERGEGKVGVLIALVVVAIAIFLGVKIIPVRIAAYEFQDFIEQECRYAAVRKDTETVRKRIIRKARELEIPLNKKHLKLERTHNEMIITAAYEKPIDLAVTTYTYKFKVKEKAPLF